jgi:hypothetical protein
MSNRTRKGGLYRKQKEMGPPVPTSQRQDMDYRIIGVHLQKAHQSNAMAERLNAEGMHGHVEAQNRLTKVFIRNALSRIQT